MSFFSDGFTKTKLMLLYGLSALGTDPTRDQMTVFFGRYDLLNYFDLQSAVIELEEGGYLAAVPRPYGQAYCVTESGAETLAMFEERLPNSLRERMKQCADEYRATLRLETQFDYSLERVSTGGCRATLRAMEKDGELLRIEILLPDEKTAKHAGACWPERAEGIYTALMNELLKE